MKRFVITIILSCISSGLLAYPASKLTKDWQHTPYELYLDAQEAYDMKKANPDKVLLLDVRTQAELHYTGIPDTVDASIPYKFDTTRWKMKKNGKFGTFKKLINPDFSTAVEYLVRDKKLNKDAAIIIMCASGTRAPFAAKKLHKAGFTKVYTQVEGFGGIRAKEGENKGKRTVSGWKVRNLPWSYDLPPEKMYFNFDPLARQKTYVSSISDKSVIQ